MTGVDDDDHATDHQDREQTGDADEDAPQARGEFDLRLLALEPEGMKSAAAKKRPKTMNDMWVTSEGGYRRGPDLHR
jgi:hypothetical protein